MNLSPTDRKTLLELVAERIVAALREEMGGSFQSVCCIDLTTASKMTGLSKPTLRAKLPIIELSDGKHGIRMSELSAYLDRQTVRTEKGKEEERSAA